jgi:hypothetical protein
MTWNARLGPYQGHPAQQILDFSVLVFAHVIDIVFIPFGVGALSVRGSGFRVYSQRLRVQGVGCRV